MKRLLVIACLALAVLAAVGCGGKRGAPSTTERTAAAKSEPRDLRSIDELRAAFNAKSAEPRLILIISPT
jgi:hypothetical protein